MQPCALVIDAHCLQFPPNDHDSQVLNQLHRLMSFGISFGSIGDLIAVGQIAWSLAQAVSSTRGSAKEFQGLVSELNTFNNVLLQVVALWQNYESSLELDELGKVTKKALKEWQDSLWEFRLKFEKKYGASLQPGGSGKWAKDASKKVLWLKERDDVIELRQKISSASGMITLLVLAAIGLVVSLIILLIA